MKLTTKERRMLCSIINRMGSDKHPVAEPRMLKYFTKGYMIKCINKALPKLKEKYQPALLKIKDKI